MKIGFDNQKYLTMQSEHIRERISKFGDKLYLEFGGKLFDDYHASRVLPGFAPDSKLQMLLQLADQAEMIISINADDIENNKVRHDLGLTYDLDVLRLVKVYRSKGLYVSSVVITQYKGQKSIESFKNKLEALDIKVYYHYPIEGYPHNVEHIVSDAGYGQNDYVETTRPLVVVTAPGPGSGKMATCLSQLYHENKRGIKAGYAKFETFPIWNLPLKHPVNMAYEAATADLQDVNMIDPFHLEAYGVTTVNYNRDVEIYPVLAAIFEGIYGYCPYKSPTDMGVNMAGNCIIDNDAVCEASNNEIIRRYFNAKRNKKRGAKNDSEIYKLELLLTNAHLDVFDRKCVKFAEELSEKTNAPAAAVELPDGTIITGKTSAIMGCLSATILNALKALAQLDDVTLIDPEVIKPIENLKTHHLGAKNPQLHINEILIALAISAVTDDNAKRALAQLDKLKHSEMHCSVMVSTVDEKVLKELGIRLTCNDK